MERNFAKAKKKIEITRPEYNNWFLLLLFFDKNKLSP